MRPYKSFEIYKQFASEPAAVYLTAYAATSSPEMGVIRQARIGIKMGYLLYLGDLLSVSLQDLSSVLNVSLRTLQRYQPDFVLDSDASSKVIQLSLLKNRGLDVFGDQTSFNDWLKTPIAELDHSAPWEFLDTPFGFQLIDQILGRIEHGIFA